MEASYHATVLDTTEQLAEAIRSVDELDRQAEAEGSALRRLFAARPALRPITDHRRSVTLRKTIRVADSPSLPKAWRARR
jgi:hypothetical protein